MSNNGNLVTSHDYVPLASPAKIGDVGFNLTTKEDVLVSVGEKGFCWTGVRVEIPSGMWCTVLPRSSTNFKSNLQVPSSVIDNGYRGEISVLVYNGARATMRDFAMNTVHRLTFGRLGYAGSRNDVFVPAGTQLGQLVFFPIALPTDVVHVKAVSQDTERGSSGFGSTGLTLPQ